MRRLSKRAKLLVAVKVAAHELRERRTELEAAASRFSTAREAKRRAETHLMIRLRDAEEGGAL